MFTCFRYLPAIGRFLIVVTFIEDSLRILTQWSDQLLYLRDFRKSKLYPDWTLAHTTRPRESHTPSLFAAQF